MNVVFDFGAVLFEWQPAEADGRGGPEAGGGHVPP
jgi:hypothetical protein